MEDKRLHVGIILDGNRRFAKRLMKQPWKGHEYGKEKVEKLVDWCKDLDIGELTLYAFSAQNFKRPKEELEYVLKLFKKAAEELLVDKRLVENDIRIRFVGRIHKFPEDVQQLMKQLEDNTKNHKTYMINFAMGYGGREEIIDAIKKAFSDIENHKHTIMDIDENTFQHYLGVENDVDLVIRTGGEKRTSNFLPWQTTYAELIFLEKMWPEFEKQDLIDCLEEYKSRQRRFGK